MAFQEHLLKRKVRVAAVGVGVGVSLLLAGCAPVPNTPTADYAGFPPTLDLPQPGADNPAAPGTDVTDTIEAYEFGEEGVPFGSWLQEGTQLAVTLWGSSNCPLKGTAIHVVHDAASGNAVSIDTTMATAPNGAPCLADNAAYTTVFWTPQDVTTTQPLRVDVAGQNIVVPIK